MLQPIGYLVTGAESHTTKKYTILYCTVIGFGLGHFILYFFHVTLCDLVEQKHQIAMYQFHASLNVL